jgi:ADP-ribose pyrophosphatase
MVSASGFGKGPEREIHNGRVFRVAIGEFVAPDGRVVERELVRHPGAVAVVPIVGEDVVLVRQYRAALDIDLLEIPAGKRDIADEAPELCAARELAEEIGMTGRLELLTRFYNSAGFSDEECFVYLGTELEPAPMEAHGIEEQFMTIERIRLADAPQLIARGDIRDAKTIIGLMLARERLA